MGIFSIFEFQNHLEPVIILTSNNSRTSNNFNMKLGTVTKVDKWNTATSKKIDDNATSRKCDIIVIFTFIVNLEQFGSKIWDAWSVKFTILLIVTFYLRKTENRAKNI